MKQNKVLSNRMEKEAYSRKQALLMLLFKICEHCLTPSKEKNTIEEVIKKLHDKSFENVINQIIVNIMLNK
jgi:hypothetical protein